MTKIVYLHGFGSSSQTPKVKFLADKFGAENVITFDIPSRAKEAFNLIERNLLNIFREFGTDIILVGTSLGGFWANYFASKYDLKCLIMNPSLNPSVSLKQEHALKMVPDWKEEYAEEYARYEGNYGSVFRVVLLDLDDEILNSYDTLYKFINNSKVVTSSGGTHRYDHLDVLEAELRDAINVIVI